MCFPEYDRPLYSLDTFYHPMNVILLPRMKISTENFVGGKMCSNKYLIHYINCLYLDTVLPLGVVIRDTCSITCVAED